MWGCAMCGRVAHDQQDHQAVEAPRPHQPLEAPRAGPAAAQRRDEARACGGGSPREAPADSDPRVGAVCVVGVGVGVGVVVGVVFALDRAVGLEVGVDHDDQVELHGG